MDLPASFDSRTRYWSGRFASAQVDRDEMRAWLHHGASPARNMGDVSYCELEEAMKVGTASCPDTLCGGASEVERRSSYIA